MVRDAEGDATPPLEPGLAQCGHDVPGTDGVRDAANHHRYRAVLRGWQVEKKPRDCSRGFIVPGRAAKGRVGMLAHCAPLPLGGRKDSDVTCLLGVPRVASLRPI